MPPLIATSEFETQARALARQSPAARLASRRRAVSGSSRPQPPTLPCPPRAAASSSVLQHLPAYPPATWCRPGSSLARTTPRDASAQTSRTRPSTVRRPPHRAHGACRANRSRRRRSRRRRWRADRRAAVKSPKLWRQHAPAMLGQRELRLPHPGIQRKRVEQDERPAGSGPRRRKGFEIAEPSDSWHELS